MSHARVLYFSACVSLAGFEPLVITALDGSMPELADWPKLEHGGIPVGHFGLVKGFKRAKAVLAITKAIIDLGVTAAELAQHLPHIATSFAAIHAVCKNFLTRKEEVLHNIGRAIIMQFWCMDPT